MPKSWGTPGIYAAETPTGVRSIAPAATGIAVFVGAAAQGPIEQAVTLSGFADFEASFGPVGFDAVGPDSQLGWAVRQFFENGGQQAWAVRLASNAAAAGCRGLQVLDTIELFNLLVLPGLSEPALLKQAIDCCERRQAFAIVDAPEAVDSADAMIAAFHAGQWPRSDHAAVYFPWILVTDPASPGRTARVAPSGSVAGLYARTAAERGVWKAPAGFDGSLFGALALDHPLIDADSGRLNLLGINAIRLFVGHGVVVWGARTLRGDEALGSDFKYVPVRRLALHIEQSVRLGTAWVALQDNNEALWAQIRLGVGDFLDGLFRQGAFAGQTARDACFVKCDRETTTASDVEQGRVNVEIGFAPLKPAEFVVVRMALVVDASR